MIFSIAMGAEYLFYMKSIETHARAFLALNILGIGTVQYKTWWQSKTGGQNVIFQLEIQFPNLVEL